MKSKTPSQAEKLLEVYKQHGDDAVYITNTGYLSRDVYELFPDNRNIFYMQGSMGLGPAIGLGVALNTNKDVVVLVGDGSLLMHLGITHTIREKGCDNLFVYVFDNGCHQSVGGYECAKLQASYPGITKIFKVKNSSKKDIVGITPQNNVKNIMEEING